MVTGSGRRLGSRSACPVPAIRNILAAAYLTELDALFTGWDRRGLVQPTAALARGGGGMGGHAGMGGHGMGGHAVMGGGGGFRSAGGGAAGGFGGAGGFEDILNSMFSGAGRAGGRGGSTQFEFDPGGIALDLDLNVTMAVSLEGPSTSAGSLWASSRKAGLRRRPGRGSSSGPTPRSSSRPWSSSGRSSPSACASSPS